MDEVETGLSARDGVPTLRVAYQDILNMGDQLTPLIVGRCFGYKVVNVPVCEATLTGVGSYLWRLKERATGPRLHVWGTGFIKRNSALPLPTADIEYHAVRGELSKRRIEESLGRRLDIPTGDPGILASRLFDRPIPKSYRLGIVPHFRERDDPAFAQLCKLSDRSVIIDPTGRPLDVIRQIASCELVLSSSFHGLVVADAFGIPNLHVKVSDRPRGDGFKFEDYYSSFGVDHPFVDLGRERIERPDVIVERCAVTREAVLRKQEELLRCFPYPKVGERTEADLRMEMDVRWERPEEKKPCRLRRYAKRLVKFVLKRLHLHGHDGEKDRQREGLK